MQMNKDKGWLMEKAEKEDGCQVSTGGLIGDIKAMGKGLASRTTIESSEPLKITGHTEPFTLHGIQIYTWPYDDWFYKPKVQPLTGQSLDSNQQWVEDALQAAQELVIKENEIAKSKQANQATDYLDPEVDKLEKKLKDIKSKIKTAQDQRKRREENKTKIAALKEQIKEAEGLLAKEMQY